MIFIYIFIYLPAAFLAYVALKGILSNTPLTRISRVERSTIGAPDRLTRDSLGWEGRKSKIEDLEPWAGKRVIKRK